MKEEPKDSHRKCSDRCKCVGKKRWIKFLISHLRIPHINYVQKIYTLYFLTDHDCGNTSIQNMAG